MGQRSAADFAQADSILQSYAPGLLSRIAGADTIDGLVLAANGHGGLVRILVQVGVPVMAVAGAVASLNSRVMARLYDLTVPADLAPLACLLVMGSEGRAEQILKTDQDNGLIVQDGVDPAAFAGPMARFSAALAAMGWPPCPGAIMVTNPHWVRTRSGWGDTLRHWIRLPGPEDFLNLAIVTDARAVAGDTTLLHAVRSAMADDMVGHGPFLAQFARVALQFDTPLGLFGQILTAGAPHRGQVDLKKGGIFPIVHGVRAFAMESGVTVTATLDRLATLADQDRIPRQTAVELRESFEFLVGLRLKMKLMEVRQDGADNLIPLAPLAPDERDDLRQAFRRVKQFKELLTHHFHLALF